MIGQQQAPVSTAQKPTVYRGMTAMQAAMAAFGADIDLRPFRASCTICNAFHVAAADEGQARHIVLDHADKQHMIVDLWKAGEL